MGILNICNLWILLRKFVVYLVGRNVIFMDVFAVKVDEVTSTRESVKRLTSFFIQIPGLTSFWRHFVNFNIKKVHEDDIFVWQDILQFFSVESKDYKYLKSP